MITNVVTTTISLRYLGKLSCLEFSSEALWAVILTAQRDINSFVERLSNLLGLIMERK